MLGYVTSADRHLVLHIQIEDPAGINVAVYHKGAKNTETATAHI